MAATWLVTSPRLVPGIFGDHGTFVSVADRLRAGDRLYADVWDNKDPLFYYLLALGRALTGYADIVLEVGWLALAAGAAAHLARTVGLPSHARLLVGWVLTPIILTGTTYTAGMTHLPAAATVLWIVALSLRERWLGVGVLLGVLLFLKLVAVPIAAVCVLVVLAARRQWRAPLPLVAGAALSSAAVIGIMVARGEFAAYVTTQLANVTYSRGDFLDSRWGPLVAHLLAAAPEDGSTAALTTLGALAVVTLLARSLRPRDVSPPLWLLAAAAGLASVLILALTALWPHHVQILYVPGVIATVALLTGMPPGWFRRPGPVAALVLTAFLLGGAAHPYWYLQAVRGSRTNAASLVTVSDEARALRALPTSGSYARLGTNDVSGHARGLESWSLACARFHQYPFDPPSVLDGVLRCLPSADAIIVDASFVPADGQKRWNRFVGDAERLLAARYNCQPARFGRVCTKK